MQKDPAREILVFGATGGTGAAIVRDALERGFGVTAFVRDIQRAQHLFNGLCSRLTFSTGDALNEADVQRAIGGGLSAVISAMGIFQKRSGHDDLTRATQNILNRMRASGPRRFVCISSIGTGTSRNQGNFTTRLIQKTFLRNTLADKEQQEAAIRDSELDWTVIRPSRLLDNGGPANYCTWTGAQPEQALLWSVNRSQVAKFALDCLDDDSSINAALSITGTR